MYNKAIKIEEHKTSTKEIRVATQENTQAERQKGNVMKNLFVVDFKEKAVVGSQSAVKKAGRVGSKEYKMLMELLEKHPTFKVVAKEPNDKKNTYDGLTYPVMEEHIKGLDNSEEMMAEYEAVKKMANGKYPLVKKWFIDTFMKNQTENKPVSVRKIKQSNTKVRIARAKASVKKPAPALVPAQAS